MGKGMQGKGKGLSGAGMGAAGRGCKKECSATPSPSPKHHAQKDPCKKESNFETPTMLSQGLTTRCHYCFKIRHYYILNTL